MGILKWYSVLVQFPDPDPRPDRRPDWAVACQATPLDLLPILTSTRNNDCRMRLRIHCFGWIRLDVRWKQCHSHSLKRAHAIDSNEVRSTFAGSNGTHTVVCMSLILTNVVGTHDRGEGFGRRQHNPVGGPCRDSEKTTDLAENRRRRHGLWDSDFRDTA